MNFEIIGEITEIETITVSSSIRDVKRLRKQHGKGRWRKLKGVAHVRLRSGKIRIAELHWYEAHDIGRQEIKRKRYLD
ncbi:MAG: hypothetical protein LC802_05315 [Acidobacteria bacterium]|nr:hypothetical protein [Acidobacteriota bacterium]